MEIEEDDDSFSENKNSILINVVNEMIEKVIAESNMNKRIIFRTDQLIRVRLPRDAIETVNRFIYHSNPFWSYIPKIDFIHFEFGNMKRYITQINEVYFPFKHPNWKKKTKIITNEISNSTKTKRGRKPKVEKDLGLEMEIEDNDEENENEMNINDDDEDEIIVPDYVYDNNDINNNNNNSHIEYEVLNPDQISDCVICGTSDKRSDIIICDRCDRDYHYKCLNPPLKEVPSGDWYCPKCMKIMESEDFFMEEEAIGHEILICQYFGADEEDHDIFKWIGYRLLNYDDEKKRFVIVEESRNNNNNVKEEDNTPKKYYFVPEKCECLFTKSINWFKVSDYPWWPGKVAEQYKYGIKKDIRYIFFDDNSEANVKKKNIKDFKEGFEQYNKSKNGKDFVRAVKVAREEYTLMENIRKFFDPDYAELKRPKEDEPNPKNPKTLLNRLVEFSLPKCKVKEKAIIRLYNKENKHYFIMYADSIYSPEWRDLTDIEMNYIEEYSTEMKWDNELSSDRCQYCRLQSPPQLIKCMKCHRSYHNSCLDPPLTFLEIIDNYICLDCLKCNGCGKKLNKYLPTVWRNKLLYYCEECMQFYYKKLICSKCQRIVKETDLDNTLQCDLCLLYVHLECDNLTKKDKEQILSSNHYLYNNHYHCKHCRKLLMLKFLADIVGEDKFQIFLIPVTIDQAPDYYNFIAHPMDISNMSMKVLKGIYRHPQEMRSDFELMIKNAIIYNPPQQIIWNEAFRILNIGTGLFKSIFGYTNPSHNIKHINQIKYEQELTLKLENNNGILPIEDKTNTITIDNNNNNNRPFDNQSVDVSSSENEDQMEIEHKSVECYFRTQFQMYPSKLKYLSTVEMCIICGSDGDSEDMIYCIDCGECFHKYCIGLKNVNRVIGWRCPNCKVCESCGKCNGNDENNLLICDNCERTFHIYCLEPPLCSIPEGNWYCGYCVKCVNCKEKIKTTNWGTKIELCISCARKEMIKETKSQNSEIEQQKREQIQIEKQKLQEHQEDQQRELEEQKVHLSDSIQKYQDNQQYLQNEYQSKINIIKQKQQQNQYNQLQFQQKCQQLQLEYQERFEHLTEISIADQNNIKQRIKQIQTDIQNTIASISQLTLQQQQLSNQLSFPSSPLISLLSSACSTPSTSLTTPTSTSSLNSFARSTEAEFLRNNSTNSSAQYPNFLVSNTMKCKVCSRELGRETVQCFRCHLNFHRECAESVQLVSLIKSRKAQNLISGFVCCNCKDGEKVEPLKREYADRIKSIQQIRLDFISERCMIQEQADRNYYRQYLEKQRDKFLITIKHAEDRLKLISLYNSSEKYHDIVFQNCQFRFSEIQEKLEVRYRHFYRKRALNNMNLLSTKNDFCTLDIDLLCTEAVNGSAYLWITSNELKPEYIPDPMNEFEISLCLCDTRMIVDFGNDYYPFSDAIEASPSQIDNNNNISIEKEDVNIIPVNLFKNIKDFRVCTFCQECGNKPIQGRLLYMTYNRFCHANCGIWSHGVIEMNTGVLKKVHEAKISCKNQRCCVCSKPGASLPCCLMGCRKWYHYACAISVKVIFTATKELYCPFHDCDNNSSKKPKLSERLGGDKDIAWYKPPYSDTTNEVNNSLSPISNTSSPSSNKSIVISPVKEEQPFEQNQQTQEQINLRIPLFQSPPAQNQQLIKQETGVYKKPRKYTKTKAFSLKKTTQILNKRKLIQTQEEQVKERIKGQLIISNDIKRCVFVDDPPQIVSQMTGNSLNSRIKINQDTIYRIGNLTVTNLGYINRNPWMHDSNYIYSKGYKAYRIYWSSTISYKRCLYCLEIDECLPILKSFNKVLVDYTKAKPGDAMCGKPVFRITSLDGDINPIESNDIDGCVRELLDRTQKVNHEKNPNLYRNRFDYGNSIYGLKSEHFFGIGIKQIQERIENLPYAISNSYPPSGWPIYKFKYLTITNKTIKEYNNEMNNNSDSFNNNRMTDTYHNESFRCLPINDIIEKPMRKNTGKSRQKNAKKEASNQSSQNGSNLIIKVFPESYEEAYAKLMSKPFSERFEVRTSTIHGWGLFSKSDIAKDSMVIEYVGELIRNRVADEREKKYTERGLGSCYMFRLNTNYVVDATMKGNIGRFINHCCEPNCYSKIISVKGIDHIVMFSNKCIKKNEEITYDYKFPFEEEGIPCNCGAANCRGRMN